MQSQNSYQSYYKLTLQQNVACLKNSGLYGMLRFSLTFGSTSYTKLTGCNFTDSTICATRNTSTRNTLFRIRAYKCTKKQSFNKYILPNFRMLKIDAFQRIFISVGKHFCLGSASVWCRIIAAYFKTVLHGVESLLNLLSPFYTAQNRKKYFQNHSAICRIAKNIPAGILQAVEVFNSKSTSNH